MEARALSTLQAWIKEVSRLPWMRRWAACPPGQSTVTDVRPGAEHGHRGSSHSPTMLPSNRKHIPTPSQEPSNRKHISNTIPRAAVGRVDTRMRWGEGREKHKSQVSELALIAQARAVSNVKETWFTLEICTENAQGRENGSFLGGMTSAASCLGFPWFVFTK